MNKKKHTQYHSGYGIPTGVFLSPLRRKVVLYTCFRTNFGACEFPYAVFLHLRTRGKYVRKFKKKLVHQRSRQVLTHDSCTINSYHCLERMDVKILYLHLLLVALANIAARLTCRRGTDAYRRLLELADEV